MLKNIKMLLIKLGLVLVITFSIFLGGKAGNVGKVAYATSNGKGVYSTVQQQKQMSDLKDVKDVLNNLNGTTESGIKKGSKGKVLIYSSHSNEKYINGSIDLIGDDLAKKLTKKGFSVEHDITDYAEIQGYNRSYYSSGDMLKSKNLSEYVLIIDLHCDSSSKPVSTQVKGNEVARLMFPNVSLNPNLKTETNLVNKIKKGLDAFGGKIYRDNVTHYRTGIAMYNLQRSPNMMLMEVGCDKNDSTSCFRANTYFSSAVAEALK